LKYLSISVNDQLFIVASVDLCILIPILPNPCHPEIVISQLKPVLYGYIIFDLVLLTLLVLKVLELLPHDEALRSAHLLQVV
jgi:hypothetical protein